MISKKYATRFCKEYWNIENYDKAIADKTQVWHCHHRRETVLSRKDLIEIGEYYNRPACELIFLTQAEHRRIHMKGNKINLGKHHSEAAKKKMSESRKGKPMSEERKKKLSESLKGKYVKIILQYQKNGEFIKEWSSLTLAAKELGIAVSNISYCCSGKRKFAGNFIWRYKK